MMQFWFALILLCSSLFSQEIAQRVLALEKAQQYQENSRLQVGGRIAMDVTFNDQSVGGSGGSNTYDYYFSPTSIGYGNNNDESRELSANLKGSRLWFKKRQMSEFGLIQSLIEVDFWGSAGNETVSNSHNIRLRHAYVKISHFTFGQSNSLFMGKGGADTVVGGVDTVLVRQPLMAYHTMLGAIQMGMALESAESTVSSNQKKVSFNDDRRADFTFTLGYKKPDHEIALALLNRELRANQAESNQSFSQNATALHLSGKVKLFTQDSLRFSLVSGSGIGRYIALNYYTSGLLHNDSSFALRHIQAYHLAYQHFWTTKLRSSLLYSRIDVESFDEDSITLAKRSNSLHLNLRYSPFKNALFSIEFVKGENTAIDETHTKRSRLYVSSVYNF
jgi:hypothetical protein